MLSLGGRPRVLSPRLASLRRRFYTAANFEAVERIRAACEGAGISMVDGTYRWLLSHSALTASDGLLLGASSLDQLDSK